MTTGLIEPLLIRVCDAEQKPSIIISLYSDMTYTERFADRDSFSFTISKNSANNTDALVPGRILIVPTDSSHATMRALIIKQVDVDDEEITVSGNDYLWELFTCRLAIYGTDGESGKDEQTGPAETVARHFIETNITESENELRQDETVVLEDAHETPLGNEVTIEGRFQTLQDIMESICTQGEIGIRGKVVVDDTLERGWYIEINILKGTDRSQDEESVEPESGTTWYVLSEANGTAKLTSFTAELPEGNLCIVYGKGTGSERLSLEVGETTATGIDRREVYINASDCEDNDSMQARGEEELAGMQELSISVDLIAQDSYGRDFFLGDIVSIDAGAYGAYALPVIEAETTYEADGKRISLTLGTEQKGLMRIIRDSITSNPGRRA